MSETSEDLFILGTNVHAFEMVEIIDRINAVQPTWTLRGFVSPDGKRVGERINDMPVVAWREVQEHFPQARVVPDATRPLPQEIRREHMATLIDPQAWVSKNARIGNGCVIYPYCYVGHKARIGDGVFCLSRCVINHDDVVGDQVMFASGVLLAGNVTVESDCYLGQGCTVRQFVTVKRRSFVGMGSVVVKEVPPNVVVVGNPARVLRERRPGE